METEYKPIGQSTAMELTRKAVMLMNDPSFSTPPDPYILTPEEEATAMHNAIEQAIRNFHWRMRDKGDLEMSILQKISETDWTEKVNRDEVLRRANANKHHQLWQQEQRAREREEAERKQAELKKLWTAGRLYQLMRLASEQDFGKPLIENEHTFPLIKTICLFLSRDPRFETDLGYNLQKGLLLRGAPGLGKTHLVECVANNPLNPVLILNMITVSQIVKEQGDFEVPAGPHRTIYLDDVGTEESVVNHYGTKVNWFKDFLELYYASRKPFNALIISTNNSFDQFEARYGFRVRSRVKDMFNVINVSGTDLRGTV